MKNVLFGVVFPNYFKQKRLGNKRISNIIKNFFFLLENIESSAHLSSRAQEDLSSISLYKHFIIFII
jgi:hypothetical protein